MDLKDSQVNGGVLIVHKSHEGKHHYEVEKVLKYKNTRGEKTFARKGDKLMQINGIGLHDVTPEELAQLLGEGNPMLTMHKPKKLKQHAAQPFPAEDTFHPVSMESTVLSFSMEMMREEDLEGNKDKEGGEGAEKDEKDEDACKDEGDEKGEEGEEESLLIVSMTKTSISVVSGRGCDDGRFCKGCHRNGCTWNDVVVVSESSTVTLVSRGGGSFRVDKSSNGAIRHLVTNQYLKGLCSQGAVYALPNPETITIFSYKSNTIDSIFRGIPVVLNFTASNCFLRCCKTEERVFLQVVTCEKQKLKQISRSDENTMSFLFYMKADRTSQRTFESALHDGWFIQIKNAPTVEMKTMEEETAQSFIFVIQK